MRTYRTLDGSVIERIEDVLAAGRESAPALILLHLALNGAHHRALRATTVDQVVWPPSACLRAVPYPRVGLPLLNASGAALLTFTDDCGKWLMKAARTIGPGKPLFPDAAFRALFRALDGEAISLRSLRVRAAMRLLDRDQPSDVEHRTNEGT